MRAPIPLLALLVGGCATNGDVPSLLPRPAEAIDPRLPIGTPATPSAPSAALARQLEMLVDQARAGDVAFESAANDAERLASAAGPVQSESWIVAQQSLSAAIAARAPVARALAEIDALAARMIAQAGGIAPGELEAIDSASARVGEIDAREAAMLDRINARLAR